MKRHNINLTLTFHSKIVSELEMGPIFRIIFREMEPEIYALRTVGLSVLLADDATKHTSSLDKGIND